ncbi:MAG: molybdopterin-dependent oxidoreductase [Acidobacteriota bacterium]
MELSRREWLKLLGVSTGAAALGVIGADAVFSVPDELFERVVAGPRIETVKNSICSKCPGGCGIRVRMIDGIPVRVMGNPLYPINRGAVCPLAEAGIEELFHPHRIRRPLRRSGRRGENKWEAISWEEALATVTGRLRDLRLKGVPQKLILLSRDHNDLTTLLCRRFMRAFGSPNFHCLSESAASALPAWLTQGLQHPPAHDFANTNYVLNFGADLLDEGSSPILFNRFYGELLSRRDRPRARIVHISSFLSRTASNSSEWVPIRPGTMAALALSVANVMIRDGSYDKDFVKNRSFGFSRWKDRAGEWHRGFRDLVSEEYYPERVAEITGVPADRIVAVARGFGAADPAFAISGRQAERATNGLFTTWAIYSLNALKGNLERPGGILFRPEPATLGFFDPELDATAREGLQRPRIGTGAAGLPVRVDSLNQLFTALQQGKPDLVDALFIHGVNPVFESTLQAQTIEALEKVPFIVDSTSFMDETTAHADLVLPEPMFLENWEISLNHPAVEFLHFGVQQPLIQAFYDTRQFGDVLLQLGQQLGGGVGQALEWENYESFSKSYARSIFNSGKGTIISEGVQLSWIEFLKKRGFRAFDYSTFGEFWDLLLEKGGWWDPIYPGPADKRILKTPSGRFEFYSQALQSEFQRLTRAAPSSPEPADLHRRWKLNVRGDATFLPHFEAPRFHKDSIDYPYHLLTYEILANRNGRGAHLGLVQELWGLQSRQYWKSWVEINPRTAGRLGIVEGDDVNIIAPQGRLVAKVRILPTIMPEVVVMPFGQGHDPDPRFKRRLGVNPYTILARDTEVVSGIPSLLSTKVRIEKA